jgi:hypothetical protein
VLPDVNGVFPTVTPPATTDENPAWNLIAVTPVGSSPVDMIQYLYWHAIGSAETNFGGPRFGFALTGDGTPANCHTANTPGCFRATGVAVNYNGTCTQDTPMCPANDGSPISGSATGTSIGSNSIASSGPVSVLANGVALGAYGTDNLTDFFGQSGSPSGAVSDGCSSGNCASALNSENANSAINAGLVIYDQSELTDFSVGPFTGTLPNLDTGNNVFQGIGILPE